MIKNLIGKGGNQTPARRESGPFDELHRQMDALINGFFSGADTPWHVSLPETQRVFNPSFEIGETEKEFHLSAELPGLTEKDVSVTIEDNFLSISGEKKEEKDEKKKNYHLYERRYGSFNRSFALPENVDTDKISAVVKNGVLEVIIPKKEIEPRKVKKIEIKSK